MVFRPHARVDDVFGWKLTSHAHIADVIRLEALLEFGGVYFDTDVLPLQNVDDWLDDGRAVLAVERPAGLINAVRPSVLLSARGRPPAERRSSSPRGARVSSSAGTFAGVDVDTTNPKMSDFEREISLRRE